jgi:hypothetical protein
VVTVVVLPVSLLRCFVDEPIIALLIVEDVELRIVCMPLSVNVFATLATQ